MWLLLFFLTPIVEMYLLIQVAGYINALPTIGLVMLTAVIGVFLLKKQGLATLTRGLKRVDSGQLPGQEIAEGLFDTAHWPTRSRAARFSLLTANMAPAPAYCDNPISESVCSLI